MRKPILTVDINTPNDCLPHWAAGANESVHDWIIRQIAKCLPGRLETYTKELPSAERAAVIPLGFTAESAYRYGDWLYFRPAAKAVRP